MLQLSNNPQLIKHVLSVLSIINFFTSWTEMFSARKAKVDVFVLVYPLFASVLLSADVSCVQTGAWLHKL